MNSLTTKKKTRAQEDSVSTSTQNVTKRLSEELLHVNGFPAQYSSAFISGKTAV